MGESSLIFISEYAPGWPAMFVAEGARLLAILTGETYLVEHIGSTAVPGLAAKPVIDIMVGAESLAAIERHVQALADHGYVYVPGNEKVLPQRRYFEKLEGGAHMAHLHGVVSGTPFWVQHLAFRDALRADPELVARYGALKRRLATEHAGDREAYTAAKAPFIRSVLAGIGAI